jgi:hypothetical protein
MAIFPRTVVGALGLVLSVAACTGGGRGPATATTVGAPVVAPTTTLAPTTTTLAVGAADVGPPAVVAAESTGVAGTGPLDATVQAQVVDAIHTYENAAVGTPLGTGQAAVLDGVLTAAAAARLTPPTRDALVDEGLPPMAAIRADRANVTLNGFTGPDQATVVDANLDLEVSARTPAGLPVKIVRNGSLTFVSDGGTWRIDAFSLSVQRELP